jgi:hypothetical protein
MPLSEAEASESGLGVPAQPAESLDRRELRGELLAHVLDGLAVDVELGGDLLEGVGLRDADVVIGRAHEVAAAQEREPLLVGRQILELRVTR